MKYNLKSIGDTRIIHIELPNIKLKNSKFLLTIKDLSGKIMLMLDGVSLPNDIRLNQLNSGKYMMTLVAGTSFFSELIVA